MHLSYSGKTIDLQHAVVMGIINLTPDSFFRDSRAPEVQQAVDKAGAMLDAGAQILDLGAMSTRPGAEEISEPIELERLMSALVAIRSAFPETFISVDTYRSVIAAEAVKAGASMINDISGGSFDEKMVETIGSMGVPYVLMHTGGKPATMQQHLVYEDVVKEVMAFFLNRIDKLKHCGAKQIVLDVGFGFGKTIAHNYRLLAEFGQFAGLGYPVLAGVSRKSMISRVLDSNPDEALNGTTVLNTIALLNKARILRVHDVKEAVECCRLVEKYFEEVMQQPLPLPGNF
jgi:dihydropteroate synthase